MTIITGPIASNQNITLQPGDELSGAIDNQGTLLAPASTGVNIGGADTSTASLSGGGVVILNAQAYLAAGVNGALLTNVDNTIEGLGGYAHDGGNGAAIAVNLVNDANGVLDAAGDDNDTGVLDINADVTNDGTLEATGGGYLGIEAGLVIDDTGGGVLAASGGVSQVALNAIVEGGALETPNGGTIVANDAVLDGASYPLTNAGSVTDNSTLTIEGVIDNSGTIAVTDGNQLLIGGDGDATGVTLQDGGVVVLGFSTSINAGVTGAVLTNVDNTIEGAGGDDNGYQQNSFNLALDNEHNGTVEADGNNTGVGDLFIHSAVTNAGTLAAVNDGALYTIGDTIDDTSGGIIESDGSGSTIYLNSNSSNANTTIEGGTLETANGGAIVAGSAVLDGSGGYPVTNAGTLTDNGLLAIEGVIDNSGTIAVTDGNQLVIGGSNDMTGATLESGGVITLGNSTSINAGVTGAVLTNVNNTIEGAGGSLNGYQQNSFNVALDNEQNGTVEANGNNTGVGDLFIHGSVTNAGTLAAINDSALYTVGDTIDDTSGGIIESAGAGSTIYLNSNSSNAATTIEGGTLETPDGGTIVANTALLDGSGSYPVTNTGSLSDNGALTIEGVIDNSGTIAVTEGNRLLIGDSNDMTGATLESGGVVVLADSTSISAGVTGAVLTNVNNTIEAQGGGLNGYQQNSFNVGLNNEQNGTVEADGTANGGDLFIHGAVTNAGTLAAVNGGALYTIGNTIDDTSGGLIEASGAGSTVYLNSNGTNADTIIEGGTLETPNGGAFVANNAVFDGSGGDPLTTKGQVIDNGALAIEGVIDNSGTIAVTDGNLLQVGGRADTTGVTLEGGGVITLGNSTSINAVAGALTNVNDTIEAQGGGLNGYQQNSFNVALENEQNGAVEADGTTNGGDLYIHGAVTNYGTLGSVNGGVLNLQSAVNNHGIVAANGGVVNVNAGLSGAGLIDISGGGQANLNVGTGEGTEFTGNGTLQITDTTNYAGTLYNFTSGDRIYLPNLQIGGPSGNSPDQNGYPDHTDWTGQGYLTAVYSGNSAGGVVAIEKIEDYVVLDQDNNGLSYGSAYDGTLFTVQVSGYYTNGQFGVAVDGAGGYDLTTSAVFVAAETWVPDANGDWDTASNWSSGIVPGPASSVFLDTPDPHTITHSLGVDTIGPLSTSATDLLSVTGGSLTVTGTALISGGLSVSGGIFAADGHADPYVRSPLIVTGGTIAIGAGDQLTATSTTSFGQPGGSSTQAVAATISGTGTLANTGVMTINDGGASAQLQIGGGLTWTNLGTVDDSGLIVLGLATADSVSVTSYASGVFDLTTDDAGITTAASGSYSLTNGGTLSKTGGTGTSHIGVAITNGGTLSAMSGTLELDAGGVLGGIMEGTGGVLALAGGVFTLAHNGTVLSGAIAQIGGTIDTAAGQVLFLTGASSFGQPGMPGVAATITGPGTLANSGAMTIADGGGTQLQLGGGLAWTNTGTITDKGQITLGLTASDSATLFNANTAVFDLTDDDAGITAGGAGSYGVTNSGTLAKTGGAGVSHIAVALTNNGTLGAATGTLELSGSSDTLTGAVTGAGSVQVDGTAMITGALTDSAASLSFLGGLTNAGAITVKGGTLSVAQTPSGGGIYTVGNGGTLDFAAGLGSAATEQFQASGGTLALADPVGFHAAIQGFGAPDTIDLTGIARGAITNISYAHGVLQFDTSGGVAQLQFDGSYKLANFSFGTDSAGAGTAITFHP